MNLFETYSARVAAALAALADRGALPAGLDLGRVVVEPTKDPAHGDLATNAAMVLAKEAGTNPRALAALLIEELAKDAEIVKAEVAGPGFINLTLRPSVFTAILKEAVLRGLDYGRGAPKPQPKINVEYVSANPTGPMHVGHGRGAVFGDALANILAFAGHDVTREYYINDAGAQVDVLARSAFLRYREALGETITIPEGLYPGDYLVSVGHELEHQYGRSLLDKSESEWMPIVRSVAIGEMMAMIRADLLALGVAHDQFFSERSLQETGGVDAVAETIADLRSRDLVYEGRLPPPKGQKDEDWEDREQTLFRATQFGDDVDRPLLKSDGSYTYFANDIAYHRSKFTRGFAQMIDVWGADHGGYVKRMKAAVKAISAGAADLDVKIVHLVKLSRGGVEVKMSKRAGEFVTLRDVVDEVGRDAVRFMMLYRKNDAPLDFDLAKVIEHTKDNPVFYVQYGHARGHSVFRNAAAVVPDLPAADAERAEFLRKGADLARLDDAAEVALMQKIAAYPRLVEAAAAAHEPHRVAFYLYELASEFHTQWTRGGDLPHLRFIIQDDPQMTIARLALVQGIVTVLASGLALLGVAAPNEMR